MYFELHIKVFLWLLTMFDLNIGIVNAYKIISAKLVVVNTYVKIQV